jgi:hypothetical protein
MLSEELVGTRMIVDRFSENDSIESLFDFEIRVGYKTTHVVVGETCARRIAT